MTNLEMTKFKLETAMDTIAKKFNTDRITVLEAYLMGNEKVINMTHKLITSC